MKKVFVKKFGITYRIEMILDWINENNLQDDVISVTPHTWIENIWYVFYKSEKAIE